MRLWTIQSPEVYEILKTKGVFHCDHNMLLAKRDPDVYNDITDAYAWIGKQMSQRIGEAPAGVVFPVWAWHTWDGQHKRPDMRLSMFTCFLYVGDKVLMEIEIPDEQVLLSDKSRWEYVLSKSYFGNYDGGLSEEEFDEVWEKDQKWLDSLTEAQRTEVIEKSWEKVFDVFPLRKSDYYTTFDIQATIWELKLDQVVKVWRFKGRPRPALY